MHTQYNLFYQVGVFASGLLLGYLRYRCGSTWLTVVLHESQQSRRCNRGGADRGL
jgi:membrane protease YdiL (CAAX protease family)